MSLSCKPNLSMYTYHWDDAMEGKPTTDSTSPQTCVDFDKIHHWAMGRSVGLNPRLLKPNAPKNE